ncbi:MAG: peptide chain release factor 1 [Elusimicrobia bacterium RIFOXYD2_FULL_34_15]|nr:MAG: peptide chain release factor 1 [Elusimicrobia bacterium RIFOXYD2_FULL_34_15]
MVKEKLKDIKKEYQEIENSLSNPAIVSDTQRLRDLTKRRKEIFPIIEKFNNYEKVEQEILHINEIIKTDDLEMVELAKSELNDLKEKRNKLESDLEELLKVKDPLDKKDVIIEIRAAAGGDESALFVAELHRMYDRYAQQKGLKTEILEVSPTGIGGIKEIVFTVEGENAYSFFKYESGTHRVQRVPKTEASGRIHTSTITVAVLVEPDDVEFKINPNDLKIDTYRAGGHGGQYLQKTDSAVRITHIPTNVVVACQDERSQLKNKLKAMKILKARIYDMIKQQQQQKIAQDRKKQVGTGDRSEKIRTYNFPQDRITDHRINENFHNIQNIFDGNLDDIVNAFKKLDLL